MRRVISLTTIPPRLPELQRTLESLDRQAVDAVYLNIPDYCLKTQSPYHLPDWLVDKQWQKLVVHYCNVDYGPATKIIPTLEIERSPDTQILICDDDHWYEDDWSNDYFDRFSVGTFVCGNGASTTCVENDLIDEYGLDGGSQNRLRLLLKDKHYAFAEAFSGVLIERSNLDVERFKELSGLSKDCFYADDLVFAKVLSEYKLKIMLLGLENVKMHSMQDYLAPQWSLAAGVTGGNKFTYMRALPTLLGIEKELELLVDEAS